MSDQRVGLLRIILVGVLGGSVCAFFIVSFGALIGRSGDTGTEHVGYWSPAYIVLAAIYGSVIGIIFYPIGHLIFLSHMTRPQLRWASWKIALATIVCGCLGAIHAPFTAAGTGLVGFFLACGVSSVTRTI